MMKCAMERPECRKMCIVCRNKSRNRRENLLGFRETIGAWLLSYRLILMTKINYDQLENFQKN